MSKTKRILGGVISILLGLIMAWWQIYLPIVDAINHKPHIDYSMKGVLLAPLFFISGIFILFNPRDVDMVTGSTQGSRKHNRYMLLFVIVFVPVAFLTYYLFEKAMKGYGYWLQ